MLIFRIWDETGNRFFLTVLILQKIGITFYVEVFPSILTIAGCIVFLLDKKDIEIKIGELLL